MDSYHFLRHLMIGPTTVQGEMQRSRHLFVSAARKILTELSELNVCAAQWINYKWNPKYSES